MTDILHPYNNSIGDWFVSETKRAEQESDLKDAEVQRGQQLAITNYLNNRVAMVSGSSETDNKKHLIIGGVAAMMVVALIMIK